MSSFEYLKNVHKIVCIGRNYAAHARELNNAIPKTPFYFLKPTSSLITPECNKSTTSGSDHRGINDGSAGAGAGADAGADASAAVLTFRGLRADGSNPSPIYIPKGVKVHHEVELGLVMKSTVSNVASVAGFTSRDLLDCIEGVVLAQDLTGRNVQADAKRAGLPWTVAKGFDTFCPVSAMVPLGSLSLPRGSVKKNADEFQDGFRLKCSVNGQTRQDASTALMLHSMREMVAGISQLMTLEAGDLVLTGTPAGVGELLPGDTLTSELYYGDARILATSFVCQRKPGSYSYSNGERKHGEAL